MRTENGDEVIEPGAYDLGDGKMLHVWVGGTEEQPELWATTFGQEVDGILNAMLLNVIDGQMECSQDEDGEFRFKVTQAGMDKVRHMITRTADDDPASP